MKKWVNSELDKNMVRQLAGSFQLPSFTAMLLVIRGMTEKEQIEAFFDRDCALPDPFSIKDMDLAVERIRRAMTENEKICVYGDYDCDGVTSTALLYSYLESLFADVMYYIPDRNAEGYGMNRSAVDALHEQGVKLIITVDNGISALEEIRYAGELGIDVVVTDHHTPQDVLPGAAAVVDPHRLDDDSPFKDYCGAGLALMLAIAMEGDVFSVLENYSDLAAFGTVADLVPLVGVNRSIVKTGLGLIANCERPGIAELIENAKIDKINAGNIGFRLAPRINAAGRLGSPYDAMTLLLTEDEQEAKDKSELLRSLNVQRQSIENEIYEDICRMLRERPELTFDRVIVVSSENWNPGVIGIVASKITEKYGKPCIIISEDSPVCKASGRSVAGFSLVDAIFACSDLLEKFGGHPMAAGLSIRRERIARFRCAINAYADRLSYMPPLSVRVDCNLNPGAIVMDMVHQLQAFEPFGYGNPKPIFGLTDMKLEKIVPLSNGKHIKLVMSRGNARLNIVRFSTSPEEFPYEEGCELDCAVSLEMNLYQNKEYLSLNLKDVRPSRFDTEKAMLEMQLYELYRRGVIHPDVAGRLPTREDFAAVYRYLKKHPRPLYTVDSVLSAVVCQTLEAFRLLMVLDIMEELKLIRYTRTNT